MTSNGDKTVLIVEDEEALARSYELYLEDEYETLVAHNGGEALAALGPDVDLILLDRRMPGMAGDDVLKRIDEWDLDFRTIIISAIDPDSDIIDVPFDGYLTKSVSKDELLAAVDRVFQKARFEKLVAEYNSVAETYDVLTEHHPQSELDADEEYQALEDRMESLETEIEDVVNALDDHSMTRIFA